MSRDQNTRNLFWTNVKLT